MNKSYQFKSTPAIAQSIDRIDSIRIKISEKKPFETSLWQTIQEKLKIEWTYDTNALEGSTLTKGETYFFLREGLTVEGKPFKDFLDARNHAEAVDYLYQIIKDERPITTGLIKEFNALLLSGISHTEAIDQQGKKVKKPATPGEFKKHPNHVLQLDGSIHRYTEPLKVPDEMEFLCEWINDNLKKLHPVIVSAISHYHMVRIHPFDDGNGRGARILMNIILIKKGFPPAVIKTEQRRQYLSALKQGDEGNVTPFIEFVAKSLLETQKIVLSDLQKE